MNTVTMFLIENGWKVLLKFANKTGNEVIFDVNAMKRDAENSKWRPENFKKILASRTSKKFAKILGFELGNGECKYEIYRSA